MEKIAETMTRQVTKLFTSDWGTGITGYASLIPEESIDQLFACFAIAFHGDNVPSQTITADKDDPAAVHIHYTNRVL